MSVSKVFPRVLKPQPKKYKYGNFFNMSRCDISVRPKKKEVWFRLPDRPNIFLCHFPTQNFFFQLSSLPNQFLQNLHSCYYSKYKFTRFIPQRSYAKYDNIVLCDHLASLSYEKLCYAKT